MSQLQPHVLSLTPAVQLQARKQAAQLPWDSGDQVGWIVLATPRWQRKRLQLVCS